MWVVLQSFLNVYFNNGVILIPQVNYVVRHGSQQQKVTHQKTESRMTLAASIHIYQFFSSVSFSTPFEDHFLHYRWLKPKLFLIAELRWSLPAS